MAVTFVPDAFDAAQHAVAVLMPPTADLTAQRTTNPGGYRAFGLSDYTGTGGGGGVEDSGYGYPTSG